MANHSTGYPGTTPIHNYRGLEVMYFDQYQQNAYQFAVYPQTELGCMYPFLGLAEEAGEVVGKVAKAVRKDQAVDLEGIKKELGDLMWNLAQCCTELGLDMGDVASHNLYKLANRKEAGTIVGEGDSR